MRNVPSFHLALALSLSKGADDGARKSAHGSTKLTTRFLVCSTADSPWWDILATVGQARRPELFLPPD
jgi:hypothetical protein